MSPSAVAQDRTNLKMKDQEIKKKDEEEKKWEIGKEKAISKRKNK